MSLLSLLKTAAKAVGTASTAKATRRATSAVKAMPNPRALARPLTVTRTATAPSMVRMFARATSQPVRASAPVLTAAQSMRQARLMKRRTTSALNGRHLDAVALAGPIGVVAAAQALRAPVRYQVAQEPVTIEPKQSWVPEDEGVYVTPKYEGPDGEGYFLNPDGTPVSNEIEATRAARWNYIPGAEFWYKEKRPDEQNVDYIDYTGKQLTEWEAAELQMQSGANAGGIISYGTTLSTYEQQQLARKYRELGII